MAFVIENKTLKILPMKTIFTFRKEKFFALAALIACLLFAQNLEAKVYTVAVSNYKFEPKELTIQVGDTVVWNNPDGHHNVNGTKATYPANPESFGNAVAMSWTYRYIFKTAGTYDYQCDPHTAFGMFGKVIVKEKASTVVQIAQSSDGPVRLYPNPARNFVDVVVPVSLGAAKTLRVYSIAGNLVYSRIVDSGSFRYDLSDLKTGVYFVEIQTEKQKSVTKLVRQ